MTWQSNLINNLLVVSILLSIGLVIYCSIKKVTLTELIKNMREAIKDE